jgi:serine/threonine protein kinase
MTYEHLINVKESYFAFHKEEWKNVSASCKDLIRMMIKKEPSERWTVEQCLKSKWFNILQEKPAEGINPQAV